MALKASLNGQDFERLVNGRSTNTKAVHVHSDGRREVFDIDIEINDIGYAFMIGVIRHAMLMRGLD